MRKKRAEIREVTPDTRYGSEVVAKFINAIMSCGKKSTAEHVVYGAFDIIQASAKEDPMKIFKQAVENVKPHVEVKSRRVGGATYQVPVEVSERRALSLSFRWIKSYADGRSEKGMVKKLAAELLDASANKGGSIKKREDVHRMAEANRAFAHYRW